MNLWDKALYHDGLYPGLSVEERHVFLALQKSNKEIRDWFEPYMKADANGRTTILKYVVRLLRESADALEKVAPPPERAVGL